MLMDPVCMQYEPFGIVHSWNTADKKGGLVVTLNDGRQSNGCTSRLFISGFGNDGPLWLIEPYCGRCERDAMARDVNGRTFRTFRVTSPGLLYPGS